MKQYRRSYPLAFVVLLAVVAIASCKKPTTDVVPDARAAEPATSASSQAQGKNGVKLPASLVSSGRIQTRVIDKRALADEIVVAGAVVPAIDGEAYVGALVSGRVSAILVREGEQVKAGQTLASIDAPEAARMQGEYLRSRAKQWHAEKVVAQERALWADKATSERALQTAESELRSAQAEVRSSLGLLVSSRVPVPKDEGAGAVSRIAVTSPIAGVVAKRMAVVGGVVSPDSSLFYIVDPSKLMIRAEVPEVVARRAEVGALASVRTRGNDQPCAGTVQARLEHIDELKRTMGVMIKTAKDCGSLSLGGFADISLRLSASSVATSLVAPRSSIVDLDGAPAIFVERQPFGEGQFDIRLVRLGSTDGVNTVIEDGISEGEKIVVIGALLLKGEHLRAELGGGE